MTCCSYGYFHEIAVLWLPQPRSPVFTPHIVFLEWKQEKKREKKSVYGLPFFSPADHVHRLCVSGVQGSGPGLQPLQVMFWMPGCQGSLLRMVFAGKQVSILLLFLQLHPLLCPILVYSLSFGSLRVYCCRSPSRLGMFKSWKSSGSGQMKSGSYFTPHEGNWEQHPNPQVMKKGH